MNISIFSKSVEDVEYSDIEKLVEEKTPESQNLEYKSKIYGRSDNDKKEMLKDIASFANAYGGFIIIGVREENNQGDAAIPAEVVGVEQADVERESMYSSCLGNIAPRLTGLKIKVVKKEEKSIIVIWIPRSYNAPHMITYKDFDQFWKRHDRQKSRMSIEERIG
jgi:predicted HTH transcriptional regulator